MVQRKRFQTAFFVCLLVAAPGQAIFADLIFLKDGRTLQGRIINQTPDTVRIEVGGASQVIRKADIQRISFDAEEERIWLQQQEQERQRQSELEQSRAELDRLRQENADLQRRREQLDQNLSLYRALNKEAAWRSLLWPGWGQYHRGERWHGLVAMGLGGLFALNVIGKGQDYQTASDEFEQFSTLSLLSAGTGNPNTIAGAFFVANEARNRKQVAASEANFAAALFLGWYFYNILDAYLTGNQLLEGAAELPRPQPEAPEASAGGEESLAPQDSPPEESQSEPVPEPEAPLQETPGPGGFQRMRGEVYISAGIGLRF